jgi:CheY-like chemotaxis protein
MESCVVVVDDEPEVRELLRDLLEDDGMEVVPVEQPAGLEEVRKRREPDLVLMDLMLPGMSGIELTRRLRNQGMSGTPMVAMSASRSMLRAAEASHLFQDTIGKPFELDSVLECVEKNMRSL